MSKAEGERESVRVTLIHETEKAWLVSADGSNEEVWLPKSQCDLVPENSNPGDDCWLMIPKWLAEKLSLR